MSINFLKDANIMKLKVYFLVTLLVAILLLIGYQIKTEYVYKSGQSSEESGGGLCHYVYKTSVPNFDFMMCISFTEDGSIMGFGSDSCFGNTPLNSDYWGTGHYECSGEEVRGAAFLNYSSDFYDEYKKKYPNSTYSPTGLNVISEDNKSPDKRTDEVAEILQNHPEELLPMIIKNPYDEFYICMNNELDKLKEKDESYEEDLKQDGTQTRALESYEDILNRIIDNNQLDDICGEKENKNDYTECRGENYECTPEDIPCCSGLKEVGYCFGDNDGQCICASCGSICRPCGNGICDENENRCNCIEDCQKLAKTEIKNYHGSPTLFINEKIYSPILTSTNLLGFPGYSDPPESINIAMEQVKKAAKNGVHIHGVGNFLGGEHWERNGTDYNKDWNDYLNKKILEADPEGYLIPGFWVPLGAAGRTEIDSESGREAGKIAIEEYVDSIINSSYANRVIGFQIMQCTDGEWRLCQPRIEGFRQWLKEKYNTNKALQEAWNNDSVTFDNAEKPNMDPPYGTSFYNPSIDAAILDYKFYKNEIVANSIDYFGNIIKKKTDERSIVMAFYGYNKYIGHKEDHFALNKLLKSDNIDIIAAPLGYTHRDLGESAPFDTFQDSIGLNNKIWINEDDTRTYLSTNKWCVGKFGYVDTLLKTLNIMKRNFGKNLVRNTGCWYKDLCGTGWWNSDELWEEIGNYKNIYSNKYDDSMTPNSEDVRYKYRPEVAVIFDEKSSQFIFPLAKYIHNSGMAEHFNRVGASTGYYLLDDLNKIPDSAKIFFFLNVYYLDEQQISSIENLKNNGNTLVWFYAPGYISDDGFDINRVSELTGIDIGVDNESSVGDIKITDNTHEITKGLPLNYSFYSPYSPLIYINEIYGNMEEKNSVNILGRSKDQKATFGVKEFDNWKSIFIGDTDLFRIYGIDNEIIKLLRNIVQYGGGHIYSDSNNPIDVNDNYIIIHASSEGNKNISLKYPSDVYDALSGDLLYNDITHFEDFFENGETNIYFYETVPECGNGVCEEGESKQNCSKDCG